jgi:hypothetical protein
MQPLTLLQIAMALSLKPEKVQVVSGHMQMKRLVRQQTTQLTRTTKTTQI